MCRSNGNPQECAYGRHEASLERLQAEVDRLKAIVGKLPKTADSVPIVPGMTVYHRDWEGNVTEERTSWAPPYPKVFGCCYSTREAAVARKEGE
jgi:hypothetical protein